MAYLVALTILIPLMLLGVFALLWKTRFLRPSAATCA